MNISEFIGFLFPAIFSLAWLILAVITHFKFSEIEKTTAAIDAENQKLGSLTATPPGQRFGIAFRITDTPL